MNGKFYIHRAGQGYGWDAGNGWSFESCLTTPCPAPDRPAGSYPSALMSAYEISMFEACSLETGAHYFTKATPPFMSAFSDRLDAFESRFDELMHPKDPEADPNKELALAEARALYVALKEMRRLLRPAEGSLEAMPETLF